MTGTASSLRTRLLLSGLAALSAAPVAFVAFGGVDQAELGDDRWDYAVTPPSLTSAAERLIGLIGLLGLACAVIGVWSLQEQGIGWRAAAVPVGLVALASAYTGLVAWLAVQPVIGANIGVGLAAMVWFVLVPGLLVLAVVKARRIY